MINFMCHHWDHAGCNNGSCMLYEMEYVECVGRENCDFVVLDSLPNHIILVKENNNDL